MSAVAAVSYRDAGPGDADALAALARDTFVATFAGLYRPADLASYLGATYGGAIQAGQIADPHTDIRLACGDGALVGYCHVGPYKLPFDTAGRRALELHRLYVVERVKGAGVAAALMDWAIARARARGAQDLYLGVYRDNVRAQRFYKRRGFEIVGAYLFPVGETMDDERIMRLRLP